MLRYSTPLISCMGRALLVSGLSFQTEALPAVVLPHGMSNEQGTHRRSLNRQSVSVSIYSQA